MNVEEKRARWRMNARRWRANNAEYWREYSRAFKRKNPDRVRAYRKSYNEKNPARILELRKLAYARNKREILIRNKEFYLQNKDRIIQQKSKYERERRLRDPAFRCMKLLKNRIIEVLKRQATSKSLRTKELIGCDRERLVKWIESKFSDGMTWENHGYSGWHVDHVRPCASFDLTDLEQQKLCFHYSNLQPLWAKENQIKSDKCHYRNI